MTVQEMSDEFTVLLNKDRNFDKYNELQSTLPIEIDEYEKSVFLTQSQQLLVHQFYSGGAMSFELTESSRRALNELVSEATSCTNGSGVKSSNPKYVSSFFELPEDLWWIVYERAFFEDTDDECISGREILIVPTTHDEYYAFQRNPFKRPDDYSGFRLDLKDRRVEVVTKWPIKEYLIRYVRKPDPIILVDLRPNEPSIDDRRIAMPCKLNDALHRPILIQAVALALSRYGMSSSSSDGEK